MITEHSVRHQSSARNTLSTLLFILLAIFGSTSIWAQILIGSEINGDDPSDYFGAEVFMPDSLTLAVGAGGDDGNGSNSGQVRVYTLVGNTWQQKGGDIDGEAADDAFGHAIGMPDANTIAIGSWLNDGNGNGSGHVRVYTWDGTNWQQLGSDIDGEAAVDGFGFSLSMPDATTIAIGGYRNDGNGIEAGHVRVFNWNGSNWQQKGSDIDGESLGDQSGYSVSMPDANTIAIGARGNDGGGTSSGHVRVYTWNGSSWQKKGSDINGESSFDESGTSVSMPDANTLAIGAPKNDGQGSNSGHVRIFTWNGSQWIQKGSDIDGDKLADNFGYTISMPDANTIAIGATENGSAGSSLIGYANVYQWDGTAWTQSGISVTGKTADDGRVLSVHMSGGNTMAYGTPYQDGNGLNAGQVRVFKVGDLNYPEVPGSGDALDFDGINDYISATSNYNRTGNYTIEFWFNSTVDVPQAIISTGIGSSGGPSAILYVGNGTTGLLTNEMIILASTNLLNTTTVGYETTNRNELFDGNWHHVALTYDGGSSCNIYIDGISKPVTVGWDNNGYGFNATGADYGFIGAQQDNGMISGYGNYKLDEFRIWDESLTQAEIREYMCQKDLSGHPQLANIAAYYRFDDGTGSIAAQDISGNANHGTLTNMDPTTDWITSGAPIGDISTQGYGTASVTLTDGTSLFADNFTGSPNGVHVYKVKEAPNDVSLPTNYTGLETSEYYGVFVAGGTSPAYDLTWDYSSNSNINGQSNEAEARLASRPDNASGAFADIFSQSLDNAANTLSLQNQSGTEYIAGFAPSPSYPTPPGSGTALEFDGVDDLVMVSDNISLDSTTKLTIETWVVFNQLSTDANWTNSIPICAKWFESGSTSGGTNSYLLNERGGFFDFSVANSSGFQTVSTPAHNFSTGTWHHIACVFNNGQVTIYLDGIEVLNQSTAVMSIGDGSRPLKIGDGLTDFNSSFKTFNGQLDEFRIWNGAALSQSEIRNHMCQKDLSAHPQITSLAAYYRFDDGTGSIALQDLSGNGNHGSLTNMDPATDWVTSGAPIGDLSTQGYGTASVTLTDGTGLLADNFTGSPDGVHIYKVKEAPNDVTLPTNYSGLETSEYYGVFVAGGSSPSYDISWDYSSNPSINGQSNEGEARISSRANNAAGAFSDIFAQSLDDVTNTLSVSNQSGTEYIAGFAPSPSYPTPPGNGDALELDGVNDHIIIPDNSSLNPTSAITVETWLFTQSYSGSGSDPLIHKAFTTHTAPFYQYHLGITGDLYTNKPSTFSFDVTVGGTRYSCDSPNGIWQPGHWYHIAGVYDGQDVLLYVNGSLVATEPTPGGLLDSYATDLLIGKFRNLALQTTPGQIDEIRIWGSALSETEIRDHMCQKDLSAHPEITNLAAYYRFDDGTGSATLQDLSGNGNHGTLTNMDPANDWVTSGAPIGDLSAQGYGTASVTLADGTSFLADNFTGGPDGVHVYKVQEAPNNTTIPASYARLDTSEYYGVHVVGGTNSTYSATLNYTANSNIEGQPEEAGARLASRANNAAGVFVDIASQNLDVNGNTIVASNQSGTEYIPGIASCIPNSSTQNITACDSYLWPANGQTYTANGNYQAVLSNVNGCDSVLTLNLTIIPGNQPKDWMQLGQDIDGEAADDLSGFSVSMPDEHTLAIGAIQNAGNGNSSGHVRIFSLIGGSWIQKGVDLDGAAAGDQSGRSVSMPDANTVAIGATGRDGAGSFDGHVRVYTWNGSAWVQKGSDIVGEAADDFSGFAVSMPDANTLAVGAPNNDGNGDLSGHVRVFQWNGSNWIQKGSDIDGESAFNYSGSAVSMPDANTLAVGAYGNNGSTGHVRIFRWNGSAWVQKGTDIDGAAASEFFGNALDMLDQDNLVVGAPYNNTNGSLSGDVRVFQWNGSSWVQRGANIEGEAIGDYCGLSVSMPDANTIAAGAPSNNGNGSNSGHVRIFTWNGSAWVQSGSSIKGEAADDNSGIAISMPNANTLAVGAPYNAGNGVNAGHVRVSTLSPVLIEHDTIVACNNYLWPVNSQLYTSSGIYSDTIPDINGCDSLIVLNLTINQSDTTTESISACDSYTWPANGQTYTASGNYMTTLSNANGCDSIVNLVLTINQSDTSYDNATACNSYTWPVNGQSYYASGSYNTTLSNTAGCDSLIILNLTILHNSSGYDSVMAVDSYTWPVNGQTYSSGGIYTDTLTDINGCDSIVTLYLQLGISDPSGFWGMTREGGPDDLGVIFKTDDLGNNIQVVHSFLLENRGRQPVYSKFLELPNGKLYGMARWGGQFGDGVIIEYDPVSNNYRTIHEFDGINGSDPFGSLVEGGNGLLYGMTLEGGALGNGTIFELNPYTGAFAKKHDFDYLNGESPFGNLTLAPNGSLFGMTSGGGSHFDGVLFEFNPATGSFTKRFEFNTSDGTAPRGSLTLASNGLLYGLTSQGGTNNDGVIFEFNPSTFSYVKKFDFDDPTGSRPYGSMIQYSNGKLYGLSSEGGSNGLGVIFEFNPNTNSYSVKHNFNTIDGSYPHGDFLNAVNGRLYAMCINGGQSGQGTLFEFDPPTDSFNKKHDFDNQNGQGQYPRGSLVQVQNGLIYGLTSEGGETHSGTVFEFNPGSGTLSKKIDLNSQSGGSGPQQNLVEHSNGKFYGMTSTGGIYLSGTIFEYDPKTGKFDKVHDFNSTDGQSPNGSLLEANGGELFGMTYSGGSSNAGLIFKYQPGSGSYVKILDFDGTNGAHPNGNNFVLASNGKIYGMTQNGGSNNLGVIFELDPTTGIYTKKYDFGGIDGSNPFGSLTQAPNGKLYGLTFLGGSNGKGVIFEFDPSTGAYLKKHDFDGPNGEQPQRSLTLTNGKLYGMTFTGGSNLIPPNYTLGTIFEFDPGTGVFAKRHDFDLTNGAFPRGDLVKGKNGLLYGLTASGGLSSDGVVFEFNPGTGAFATTDHFDGTNGSNPWGSLLKIGCDPDTNNITDTACDNYTWAANGTTYFSSAIDTSFLTNSEGCDSIVILNITINNSDTTEMLMEACNSYTWPLSGQTYSASGNHQVTLTKVNGCDSVLVLNLTINSTDTSELTAEACDSYTWPVNGQTYTASGDYSTILTNAAGCDSVVKLSLTLNNSDTSHINHFTCNSYTWPANGQTYTSSGIYQHSLTNTMGCDSVVKLNLVLYESDTLNQNISACNSYTWSANGQTYTASGNYQVVLSNTNGCDSVVNLALIINQSDSVSESVTICDSYTWPVNGQSYASSGTYVSNLTNSLGCDSVLILNLTIITGNQAKAAVQLGADIDGEFADDLSGYSISMADDRTIAIGAVSNDDNGSLSGHVRVFKETGGIWTQVGTDIAGEAGGDRSSWSVSMGDALTLAIGAPYNNNLNGANAGHVRVFEWDGSNWMQKGQDIDGEAADDLSGSAVSMPDANTLAVGARLNDGNGNISGQVRIYQWNGSAWIQKGLDIDGEAANNQSGWSLSMPDPNTVAIGAIWNSSNGNEAGHVRVFAWNGAAWVLKGAPILGVNAGDRFGYSVSMPDANTMAAGAPWHNGSVSSIGHTRVFSWNGSAWIQKGQDIDGVGNNDRSGHALSMANPDLIVIGAVGNDDNGSNAGQARVFRWDGSGWAQQGTDLNGEASMDEFGQSVSTSSGNSFAVAGHFNDVGGARNNAGHVRVFSLSDPVPSIDSVSSCTDYQWTANNETYSSGGFYSDTIQDINGCDSIVQLALVINQTDSAFESASACINYTWPANGQTYSSTGIYTTTLVNQNGCDSIVHLSLTINSRDSIYEQQTACIAYTWPVNGQVYAASGIYSAAFSNANGCDSTVYLDLTINSTDSVYQQQTACTEYTWPVNGQVYAASGIYFETFSNTDGCDSIVYLDLTINQADTSVQNISACESYTWPANGQTYFASGMHTTTLTNQNACDSIVNLNLVISNAPLQPDSIIASPYYCPGSGQFFSVSDDSTATSYTWTLPAGWSGSSDSNRIFVNIGPAGSNGDIVVVAHNSCGSSPGKSISVIANNCDDSNPCTYDQCDPLIGCINTFNCMDGDPCTNDFCDSVNGCYSVSKYLYIIDTAICDYDSIFIAGAWRNYNGSFTIYEPNDSGCFDEIRVNLSILPSSTGIQNETACNSYTWPANGQTYTISGNYQTTLTSSNGCDSIVTLALTINQADTSVQNISACESYTWPANGQTYNASGNHMTTLTNANGCDSIINLFLTINQIDTTIQNQVACVSYYWPVSGETYTSSGQYHESFVSAEGCDSVVELNLSINYTDTTMESVTTCDEYTWPANGQTYKVGGNYTTTLTNTDGCDSVVKLALTLNYADSTMESMTACDEYTWPANGQTYTTSGNYVTTLTNGNSCDSVVKLSLTINPSDTSHINEFTCDSYTWPANGQTYTASGIYMATLSNGNSCDSLVKLNLVLNTSDTTQEIVTANNSYLWPANGVSYTSSGNYMTTLTNSNGCDSVINLDLTINLADTVYQSATACDEYQWILNGETYLSSGVYYHTISHASGDSVYVLNLTIIISLQPKDLVQLGSDILGDASGDLAGWSLSMPNEHTLAIGSYLNDDGGNNSGQVKIYIWNGSTWIQKGQGIEGESDEDESGVGLSMPDENTVAIGAPKNVVGGVEVGHVRVYSWNGSNWVQKGNDLNGDAFADYFGASVSMPHKDVLAIGARNHDGGGLNAGAVRIFAWNDSSWVQRGADIYGEGIEDRSGSSIWMPDEYTIAIGATENDGNGVDAGHVRIFNWNGSQWIQKGADIDGQAAGDLAGRSVNMPDANTIAIGSPENDAVSPNAGQVRIFEWVGNSWIQKGTDINGPTAMDQLGSSVSMPDANTLAAGAPIFDVNGVETGRVFVYKWNGSKWQEQPNYIVPDSTFDFVLNSPISIAMPNARTLGVGFPGSDQAGDNAGQARVFRFTDPIPDTDSITTCVSYTWLANGQTYFESGLYRDTLSDVNGCDSIAELVLTINNPDSIQENIMVCDSYTWPANGQTYIASGNYQTVLTNASGCDSTIYLDLTINSSDTSHINEFTCDSYTWPANGQNYTVSGIYQATLTNRNGCDSVVKLNLVLFQSDTTYQIDTACAPYSWIDGNSYTASTNTPTFALTNKDGCDSILRLNLTILESTPLFELHINAGGGAYTALNGDEFIADQFFIGGSTATTTNPIANTDDQALFQSERWDQNLAYDIPVSFADTFLVSLYFAETDTGNFAVGKRIFDLSLEGELVLDDYDIFAETGGGDIAVIKTYKVYVGDGILSLTSSSSADNAQICAISVVSMADTGTCSPCLTIAGNTCLNCPAVPTYATTLPDPIVIGTGLSNQNMAVMEQCGLNVGIKAHKRFLGDIIPTGNIYEVEIGESPVSGSDPTPDPGTARWNYLVSVNLGTYTFDELLVYQKIDFDPADGTGQTGPYVADISQFMIANGLGATSLYQESQNLGFSFWQTIGDPSILPFDPFATGIYDQVIEVWNKDSVLLLTTEIRVEVFKNGCTDPSSVNYDPTATRDDGSCDNCLSLSGGSCTNCPSLPTYNTTLPDPILIGSGISNMHMAVMAQCNLNVGIKAHKRFLGDIIPTGNTYEVEIGESPVSGSDPTPDPGTARWNYLVSVNLGAYTFNDLLVYQKIDFDPTDGAGQTGPYVGNISQFMIDNGQGATSFFQSSENIGFGFWQTIGDTNILPFDPFVTGVYDQVIEVWTKDSVLLLSADMRVEVFKNGCIDPQAIFTYDSTATKDDGSCDTCFLVSNDSCTSCPAMPSYNDTLPDPIAIGSGLSNVHMAVMEQCDLNVGIKAHKRFLGDIIPTGNTYEVEIGESPVSGSDPTPDPGTARWNYLVSVNLGTYTFNDLLVYQKIDFDPADGAGQTGPYVADLSQFMIDNALGGTSVLQASENLGFGFWQTIGDAAILPFDPFATGVYDQVIEVWTKDSVLLLSADMRVEVFSPCPDSVISTNLNICAGDSAFLAGAWQATPGVYIDTLTASDGCDSTVSTTLALLPSDTVVETAFACDSYTWPVNGQTYYSSDVYQVVLTNFSGCDSVVRLSLVINESDTTYDFATACNSYTWLANGQTYNATGLYTTTLTNIFGCDSIVNLELAINQSDTTHESVTTCDSYTWPVNGQTYSSSGKYFTNLMNQFGCDSLVELNLVIKPSVVLSINDSICSTDSIFVGGGWQNMTGTYYDTLTAGNGCDSILETHLYLYDSLVYALNLNLGNLTSDKSFTAADGRFFESESFIPDYRGGTAGSASSISLIGRPIANTPDDTLYWYAAFGNNMQLSFPVPDVNSYEVSIYMAETYFTNDNARVFDIILEGNTVLQNLDIHKEVGANTALVKTYTVYVSDGVLNMHFPASVNNAEIAGVSIVSNLKPCPLPCEDTTYTNLVSICAGDSLFVGGAWQTTSGIYCDTLTSTQGCDSVVCTNLSAGQIEVISMDLISAPAGSLISTLTDGYVINKALIPTDFSIEAIVCSGTVGSVVFNVNGNNVRTESVYPYMINGDNPPGVIRAWNPSVGFYTITATPYSGAGGNGSMGTPLTYTIQVIDQVIVADCNGDLGGGAFYNDCNECVGGNTGKPVDFAKDDCGICFGNNADKDCNGDCFGSAVIDSCGECVLGNTGKSFNNSCNIDCNGDLDGTASLDSCGVCTGGNTGVVANSNKDCAGVCFGTAVIDSCGECVLGNTGKLFNASCEDCNGDPNGTAYFDDCGICAEGNTGKTANADKDTCGVCFGNNFSCAPCQALQVTDLVLVDATTNQDIVSLSNNYVIIKSVVGPFSIRADVCNGDTVESVRFFLDGNFIKNENIVPYAINGDNASGYHPWNIAAGVYQLKAVPYSSKNGNGNVGVDLSLTLIIQDNAPIVDCFGDVGGSALINDCGECVGGNTGKPINFGKDDCGVCYGNNADKDCAGVCFGTAVIDDCGECVLGTTGKPFNGSCTVDCNGDINGTAVLDDCGICAGGNSGKIPNADKDTCGVCFGNNLSCAPCQPLEVVSLTLMNTGFGGPIRKLNPVDTIIKTQLGSFSVRADVCNSDSVKNVRFFINSALFQNENIPPYAIDGDLGGSFNPWNVSAGNYMVTAIPYSQKNGNGIAGISKSIDLWILDNDPGARLYNGNTNVIHDQLSRDGDSEQVPSQNLSDGTLNSVEITDLLVKLFPNPTESKLNFNVINANSEVNLMLIDGAGKLIMEIEYMTENGQINNHIDLSNLAHGIYMLKLTSGDQIYTERVIKN